METKPNMVFKADKNASYTDARIGIMFDEKYIKSERTTITKEESIIKYSKSIEN